MRRVLVTILVAAVVVGALTALALESLSYWKEQDRLRAVAAIERNSACAETNGSLGCADTVQVENPYEHLFSNQLEYYSRLLAGLSIVSGLWIACIVLPLTVGTRRLLKDFRTSRILSYVPVIALSAMIFPLLPPGAGPWPPFLVIAIGGVIGLVAAGIVDRMMPPTNSLERTRER